MGKRSIIYAVILCLSLSSCARSCQSFERGFADNTAKNTRVTLYSGGQVVKTWEFNGIINSSQQSDGYFFYVDGKLVEVSGDVVIEYLE